MINKTTIFLGERSKLSSVARQSGVSRLQFEVIDPTSPDFSVDSFLESVEKSNCQKVVIDGLFKNKLNGLQKTLFSKFKISSSTFEASYA